MSAVVQKLGSREKGAQIWVAEGERYLRDGELRLAMRRCNEGWLLNPSFYKVYWCLGRIQNERGLPGEAVGLAERAIELVDDDYQRPALLADLGAMYVGKAGAVERSDTRDSQRLLRKATDLFAESTKIDDSYSPAYRGWAIALYRLGEYEAARSKYESAVARGEKYWPSGFEASLAAKRGK
ncbi:MAG: hypothetical protein R3E83_23120 [Burkholderiaceae bacterium]